jgi:hypothetical protein
MAAKRLKYRYLSAGEIIRPTDEFFIIDPIDKWVTGSLNVGKKLPLKYVMQYRRLNIKEASQTVNQQAKGCRKAKLPKR